MIISFSGLDGVGKSTHAQATITFLREKGLKIRLVETHRLSVYSIIGRLVRRFSRDSATRLLEKQYDLKRASFTKRSIACIRKMSTFIDLLTFLFFVILPDKLNTGHIVCDRHLLDSIIQLRYLGLCGGQFYRFFLKWIPMPDVPILILAEPKAAYDRKPEYSYEHFAMKDMLYRDAISTNNLIVVNNQSLEDTQREIEKVIIEGLG